MPFPAGRLLIAALLTCTPPLQGAAYAQLAQLSTRDTDAFRAAVASAVQAWRATNPDTSFLSVGNDIQYGIGWLESLKPTEASWRFESAVKAAPGNVHAWYFLGLSYYGMGRWADARRAFAEVNSLAPEWASVTGPWVGAAQRAETQAAAPKPAPAPKPGSTPGAAPAPKPTSTTPAAKPFPKSIPAGPYTCRAQIRTLVGSSNSGGFNVPQYAYRSEARGNLTIVDAARYRIGTGTYAYAYDPRTGKITWKSGPYTAAKPGDSEYGLDQNGNRVISVWIGGEQRFCVGGKG
ncbi:tetratricopeptide repeat protein [Deinococcus hohokamensis]|uniref:Tetratricopeptide repeat protein n=1 Tax=Deinococcus hohokamensis TaxID=309883 RepID=A0ABV9I7I4_9DEIO